MNLRTAETPSRRNEPPPVAVVL